jgi:cupin fold WbuC family metalloprotein
MSTVFFASGDVVQVGEETLAALKEAAARSLLKRARLCLHRDHADPVQEMVIAFCRGSYVPPHRHVGRTESFHVIEGELVVVFFDGRGEVTRGIRMSPCGRGATFLYRLSASLWHTVVPLSQFAIIHETTTGPFRQGASEIAPWAPTERDVDGIQAFQGRVVASMPTWEKVAVAVDPRPAADA